MLTEIRWQREQELMHGVFPEFRPFNSDSRFGFEGYLRGPRSGGIYRVTLEAEPATYPQCAPKVSMSPQIGIHWIGERERRRLCMEREWKPARSTFANTLLAVVRYLAENDPQSGSNPSKPQGRGNPPQGREFELNPNAAGSLAGVLGWWRGRGLY